MFYLICLASGALCALPMIFDGLWFLEWLSLAPLFYIFIEKKPLYRYGLIWGFGYYGALYYWFTYLYPLDFAGFDNFQSLGIVALAWTGLTLLQSLGTALIAFLFRLAKGKRVWFYPFALAGGWTVCEWLQTQTWMGVPFFRIALSQCPFLPAIQSASLLGSLFTGFLIALVNGFIALAVHFFKKKRTSAVSFISLMTAVLIFTVNCFYGFAALALYKDDGAPVKIALIQGNIGSSDKWKDDSVTASLGLYDALTRRAVKVYSPDIVIWPETVINVTLRNYKDLQNKIAETASDTGAVILTGTFDYSKDETSGEINTYNAIAAFFPEHGMGVELYYKRHPVPFGEYLPMPHLIGTLLPALAEMNVFSDDITAGGGPAPIDTAFGKIGGLVCFDSIYETLARSSALDGAGLIALVTNDSWYYDSAAVYQHNKHAQLRAVETGRYVARAANTGISSIIKPTGGVAASLGPLKTGYVTGEVYFKTELTLYDRIGNIIVIISAGCCALCAVFKTVDTRREKNKNKNPR